MQKLLIRGIAITLASANLLLLCNSSGQVSLNIVGYVNKQYPEGWSLIANPLDNTSPSGNTLNVLFGNTMPDGAQISKWTGSSYNTFTYDTVGWLDASFNYVGASVTLVPGVGAVLHTPTLPPNLTWVGDVIHDTGPPPNDIIRHPATPPASPGVYLLASTFPVVSSFADVVGRAPNNGEAVLTINSLGSPTVVQFDSGGWVDSGFNPVPDPTVGVAESAFFALGGADFANWHLPGIVPEPGTFTLLALGSVILFRRRE
jgi:hypothetical protein